MTASECVRCQRPTPDGYACHPCSRLAAAWLAEIADMVPAARDVAQRQARRGTGGAATGKPGSSLPIDLGATARLDAVQGQLGTWVRHVAEERGVNRAEINARGLTGLSRSPEWVDPLQGLTDDLSGLALWLADHCEWMRHRREVDEWLTDVEACARVVRGIARGPAAQRYLGPCGAETEDWESEQVTTDGPGIQRCEGDVYGPQGGSKGTCRTCGAQVDQDERKAWLDEQVAEFLADEPIPARDIAFALRLNVKTIRTWATEIKAENGTVIRAAKLRTFYRRNEHVVPWTEIDPTLPEAQRKAIARERGPRLHYVGDVRVLAQRIAEQREVEEARRAGLLDIGAG